LPTHLCSADCDGKPPVVDLDSKIYKKVAGALIK